MRRSRMAAVIGLTVLLIVLLTALVMNRIIHRSFGQRSPPSAVLQDR